MPLDTIAAGRAWTYSHNIGRRATAGMGFNWPIAMAVGKDGVMFVANRTPHISKFTIDQEFIHEFGRTGEFEFLSGFETFPAKLVPAMFFSSHSTKFPGSAPFRLKP